MYVPDDDVLVLEPVVHFLADVPAVLLELAEGTLLEVSDPLVLPVYLCLYSVVQLLLPGEPLLLLDGECLLDLSALLMQCLYNLPLLLHSRIPLRVYPVLYTSQIRTDRV